MNMYRISILKPVGVVLTSAAGYKVVSLVVGTCFNSCRELELILSSLYRYCRQQEVQLRADACAINLRNKDPIKFWQSVKKASNRNATKCYVVLF